MEQDPKLKEIIREHLLISAPENFTESVITKLSGTQTAPFKPLIGKPGKIFIFAFIALIIVLAIIGAAAEANEPILNIPDWNFALPEIDWKIPAGLLAGLIAVFVLVVADSVLNRSRST